LSLVSTAFLIDIPKEQSTVNKLEQANAIVRAAIVKAVAAGTEIGVQVCAYHQGHLAVDTWGGLADETTGRPVDGDTLFNVYSVTKAVVATALHIQAERGLIDYDAPVATYWPEYGANGKQATTVRHVLTHRAGVPQMPEGVTPELMCDWSWMTRQLAAMAPLAEPGTKTLYQAMTFGWLVGELVCRTDPKRRSIGRFIREEIAEPLGIADLWVGIPDAVEPRVAKLTNAGPLVPEEYLPPLYRASTPAAVDLVPQVFQLPIVRRAELAGAGGIFTARAEARFFAMLANGGELDGVRLLSKERVASFSIHRANAEEPDPVMFNMPMPITLGGYWYGGGRDAAVVRSMGSPRAFGHPGVGGSIGWADPDLNLAVALCHNRMFVPQSPEEDPIFLIALAVREALGLPYPG
jgi:CubicO group peptidase (beta-lactamase class C family)